MSLDFEIRPEAPGDEGAIGDVTIAAFAPLGVGQRTEQFVIEALRAAGALTVSLVAVTPVERTPVQEGGQVVGHIAFSPVAISDGSPGWYGLGPVAVLPAWQRQGVGKALIFEGLARLRELGAQGCCLVGHPEYYPKFGFRNPQGLTIEGVPAEVFFALPLEGPLPQGVVTFHPAFGASGA
jgi:putative acetyltransferase